jgi:hypothetical protein
MQARQGKARRLSITGIAHVQDTSTAPNAHEELSNLSRREVFGRFDLHLWVQRFEEKVGIHQGMNETVKQHNEDQPCRLTRDGAPHDCNNTSVVVDLEKGWFFSLMVIA